VKSASDKQELTELSLIARMLDPATLVMLLEGAGTPLPSSLGDCSVPWMCAASGKAAIAGDDDELWSEAD
jgi:hypothetical protein